MERNLGAGQGSAAPSPESFGKPPLAGTAGCDSVPVLVETFPPAAGSARRRRPSCRSISSQAAMVSRSCRCRCSTASSSCWARSSRGGGGSGGGGLPPSPKPALARSTPAASRSPPMRLGVAVPLRGPARGRGRGSGTGSRPSSSLPPGSGPGRMSPARGPGRGLSAAVAARVGWGEGPAAGAPARAPRGLRAPPTPAPGARLLRLPGSGARRAVSPEPGSSGWSEALRAAVAELRAGAVVAVPTDTLYGLACAAGCSAALGALYRLKGRSRAKPLAVCLGRVADVYRYCRVNVPEGLLQDLLPGPVTLVMERSEELHEDLNPFTRLVGIRIPAHDFMQDLACTFGGPIALTSANLSAQASSLNVEEFQDLWPHLSLVIDGGPIGDGQSPECRLGSTVVDLSIPGKFGIIRPGCALESTTAILQQKYRLLPSHGS